MVCGSDSNDSGSSRLTNDNKSVYFNYNSDNCGSSNAGDSNSSKIIIMP